MTVKIYKVGGCVRDKFLGVKSKDIDYAVEAPSFEAMVEYVASRGKIFLKSPEYLTVRGMIDGEAVDFVLCRKDGIYTDGRRPDSVEIGDIYDDLARRDFTMNAIAEAEDGKIIDPYYGRQAIEDKMIKCVGSAKARFSEDSLRLLRAIRFAITKDFTVDWDINECLMDREIIKKLENVSHERIREELYKCFHFDTLTTLNYLSEYWLLRDFIFHTKSLWLEVTSKKK